MFGWFFWFPGAAGVVVDSGTGPSRFACQTASDGDWAYAETTSDTRPDGTGGGWSYTESTDT